MSYLNPDPEDMSPLQRNLIRILRIFLLVSVFISRFLAVPMVLREYLGFLSNEFELKKKKIRIINNPIV
jgi:hypothetical protein